MVAATTATTAAVSLMGPSGTMKIDKASTMEKTMSGTPTRCVAILRRSRW